MIGHSFKGRESDKVYAAMMNADKYQHLKIPETSNRQNPIGKEKNEVANKIIVSQATINLIFFGNQSQSEGSHT